MIRAHNLSKYEVAANTTRSGLRQPNREILDRREIARGERQSSQSSRVRQSVLIVCVALIFYLLAILPLYILAGIDSRRIYLVVACVIFGGIDRSVEIDRY